ncbi:MAG: MFS transporter, partial [Alphaproteobacteria bacterium]|nr:MFS transporter [Alphaproteobacteria bacterium]
MLSALKSILALLLSYGLLISANGMFASLLGLRSRLEGFSTETTGFIMSGMFVGMLIGAFYGVKLVSMVGHIRSFAVLASVMSVAVLSHVLKVDVIFWFILRIVAGFCLSGMTLVVESWLNENSENNQRGKIMSLYMMTNYLGYAIGQYLLLLEEPTKVEPFIIASIVLSLALVPILMTRSKAPAPQAYSRLSPIKLLRISPLGVIGVMAAGMISAPISTLGAVFGREAGLEMAQISTLVACFVLGGMTLQYPIGRISDR